VGATRPIRNFLLWWSGGCHSSDCVVSYVTPSIFAKFLRTVGTIIKVKNFIPHSLFTAHSGLLDGRIAEHYRFVQIRRELGACHSERQQICELIPQGVACDGFTAKFMTQGHHLAAASRDICRERALIITSCPARHSVMHYVINNFSHSLSLSLSPSFGITAALCTCKSGECWDMALLVGRPYLE
jgi:hypothetical protein